MFRQIKEWTLGNPLDRLLKPYRKWSRPVRCLVYWNRGLGDIPLGLYALCTHLRRIVPQVKIVFLTRVDLADAFTMLENVEILVDPSMKRGEITPLDRALAQHGLTPADFDLVLEKIDSKRWLDWQLGTLTPQLAWNAEWDRLAQRFGLSNTKKYLGVHVVSETSQYYGYEKNWSPASFQRLFDRLAEQEIEILLFGITRDISFQGDHITDLRGTTALFEMIAIIKNHCSHLLAPDSGVLSIVYYINAAFPLKVVSLWADPRQGVLKQKVRSPNPYLEHHPLIGSKECIENISVEEVIQAL